MLLDAIIQALLRQQEIPFRRIPATEATANRIYASVSLLKDTRGIVMAMYHHGHQFDLPLLKSLLERSELRFMSLNELQQVLGKLEKTPHKQSVTNFDNIFQENKIQLIIDEPLSTRSEVLLITDNPIQRIQVDIWDMQIMVENALIGGIFSHTNNDDKDAAGRMNTNLLEQLEQIDHLPVMPTIATDLLALQANPDGSVEDMVRIIAHDPALSTLVLRYANSALFGFSGQISNLQDAIFRVLGYETVLYMSLGAALGRAFKLPPGGRLNMKNFWTEATFRATLNQQLAQRMPKAQQPNIALAYLTGLLHNIGIVIMGNLFSTEFNWLNKMLTSRPQQSLVETEQNLFGCTHATVGAHLMKYWNMPTAITTVVGEHHNPDYTGEAEDYVALTRLAGQALATQGLSDSDEKQVDEALCQQLGLAVTDVEEALLDVLQEDAALEAMANSLCA